MIGEFLLSIVFTCAAGFFSIAPDISWNVDTGAFTYVRDILSVVGYLVPMGTVRQIVVLIVAITIFRCAIALGKTIWDLLPIV